MLESEDDDGKYMQIFLVGDHAGSIQFLQC